MNDLSELFATPEPQSKRPSPSEYEIGGKRLVLVSDINPKFRSSETLQDGKELVHYNNQVSTLYFIDAESPLNPLREDAKIEKGKTLHSQFLKQDLFNKYTTAIARILVDPAPGDSPLVPLGIRILFELHNFGQRLGMSEAVLNSSLKAILNNPKDPHYAHLVGHLRSGYRLAVNKLGIAAYDALRTGEGAVEGFTQKERELYKTLTAQKEINGPNRMYLENIPLYIRDREIPSELIAKALFPTGAYERDVTDEALERRTDLRRFLIKNTQ